MLFITSRPHFSFLPPSAFGFLAFKGAIQKVSAIVIGPYLVHIQSLTPPLKQSNDPGRHLLPGHGL